RVRLGIGHPDNGLPPSAVVNHVLAGFSKADQAVLEHNILLVTENIGLLLKDGVAAFSNRIGNLNKSTLK
ncbi:MAG: aminoacyl-tRNA hydrolase, partial [Alphaproteobacteria bacterium]